MDITDEYGLTWSDFNLAEDVQLRWYSPTGNIAEDGVIQVRLGETKSELTLVSLADLDNLIIALVHIGRNATATEARLKEIFGA